MRIFNCVFVGIAGCLISGITGLLVGGTTGYFYAYAYLELQSAARIGPGEFEILAVYPMMVLGAVTACIASVYAVAQGEGMTRATLTSRNLLWLVLIPTLVVLALALAISKDFAWLLVYYLASCTGILAGVYADLLLRRCKTSNQS